MLPPELLLCLGAGLGAGLVAIISSNVRVGTCGRCCSRTRGGEVRSMALSLLLPAWPGTFVPDGLLPVIVELGAYAVYGYPRLSGDEPVWRRFRSLEDALLSAGTVPPAVRRKSSHVTSSGSLDRCECGRGRRDEDESLIPIRRDVVSRACSRCMLHKDYLNAIYLEIWTELSNVHSIRRCALSKRQYRREEQTTC